LKRSGVRHGGENLRPFEKLFCFPLLALGFNVTTPCNLFVILGPTASGKTRLAARMAAVLGAEILSADSRQVYRGMDIGTGKDKGEYIVNGKLIRYHLIDIISPEEEFNVFSYQRLFFEAFADVRARGITPIMVGGTGLYVDSVLRGYDMPAAPVNVSLRHDLDGRDRDGLIRYLLALRPVLHNTTDLMERERLIRAIEIEEKRTAGPAIPRRLPELKPLILGLRWDRDILGRRIAERLDRRLEEGLIDEVSGLHDGGVSWERLEALGLEYRYVGRYLQRKISRIEMVKELNIRIRQFAKRQMSWFRRMERLGIRIIWIEGDDYERGLRIVRNALGD
jgi:tRNA dimethylallyltransferase